MKVYVVIWEDRHQDTEVFVFTDEERAIVFAEDIVGNYGAEDPDDIEIEVEVGERAGRVIYSVIYNVEGDLVWVEEQELR